MAKLRWGRVASGAILVASGCDLGYPEVVVVNDTEAQTELRNIGYSGCVWSGVLAYGQATTVGRCLPGEDRVHFQKRNAAAELAGTDESDDGMGSLAEGKGRVPLWFSYQTVRPRRVDYGTFHVVRITADDIEQDFSVPGPYGH